MPAPTPEPEIVDPVAAIASNLLSCAVERLAHYGVPPCAAYWYPGSSATWDTCGEEGGAEGQLWVAVGEVFPTDNFPTAITDAHRCLPAEFGVPLILGLLRCAAVVDDHGNSPTPEQMTADAVKVSRDRRILEEAILCCFVDKDDDPGIWRMGNWQPLGPNGSCVGGQWNLTVRTPRCACPPPPPEE